MPPLRGALYGCGMISEFHLRGWQRIGGVEIVALGNRTPQWAEDRRAAFVPQARLYAEIDEMLDRERPDFVDILTPPALHHAHCLVALERGIDVVCQKPLSDRTDHARLMAAFARDRERILAVHENHRYRPWFQEILRRAEEGFFGTIHHVSFEQFDAHEPAEAYKLQSPQGVLFEYGTHLVDMIHALLGPPQSVVGRASRLNPRVAGESFVELLFDCGAASARLAVGWKPAGLAQGGVSVIGDRGEAHYEGTMTRGATSRFRLLQGDEVVLDEARSPLEDYIESFFLFQREVVQALATRGPVPQPASEHLAVLETTFAAYDAIGSGDTVRLRRE